MTKTHLQAAADRRTAAMHRNLGEQLRRLVDDAGITECALAAAGGLSQPYVCRILAGDARPTFEAYQRLGAVLGADLAVRYYPSTGPAIHDRHQARLLELLLGEIHPRWHPFTEVAVRRPARGWIDAALHDPRESILVATELQGELRRLEQLVRWQEAKAESVPSWEGYAGLGEPAPSVSRLLLVRRTRATRAVAVEFARQLRTAYPAHPDDALGALTGTNSWPGAALLWAVLDARGTRFVPRR